MFPACRHPARARRLAESQGPHRNSHPQNARCIRKIARHIPKPAAEFPVREKKAAVTDEYSKCVRDTPRQKTAKAIAYSPPDKPNPLYIPRGRRPLGGRTLRARVPCWDITFAGIPRSMARAIPGAPSRLLMTMAISAPGMRPAATLSASASKFDPRPLRSTAIFLVMTIAS